VCLGEMSRADKLLDLRAPSYGRFQADSGPSG
jgi:hypothetical protein